MFFLHTFLIVMIVLLARPVMADTVNLAVASNFIKPVRELANVFEAQTGHEIKIISGSTGKHFAQIQNGAPYHVFLSADHETPQRLIDSGLAESQASFTYAIGRLALWGPGLNLKSDGVNVLKTTRYRYLSIANPKLAPYGKSSLQVVEKYGLYGSLKAKIVRGENINQAFRYVSSGNAELGFVAYSQVINEPIASLWLPDINAYDPIRQDGLVIRKTEASVQFAQFLQSEIAHKIILNYGYYLP